MANRQGCFDKAIGPSCYHSESRGDMQRVHSQVRLRTETAHKRVEETLWSTGAAANFPCRNDVTRVLSQLAEIFF